MSLKHVQRTYEKLGQEAPLYAVLSERGFSQDPEAVFASGREEIAGELEYVRGLALELRIGRALDFGCGVGRLSQALCASFERVDGIDISDSMVRKAQEFNRYGDRCNYQVNVNDDLRLFEDDQFDFVYSNITLQHIPPQYALRYIAEFIRVLRPGGIALFHVPSGKSHRPGSIGAKLYTLRRVWLRRLWKRVRGRPAVDMHYIGKELVQGVIADSGGRLVEVVQHGSVRTSREGTRYCVVKPA
jgi:SAM-dependent methyltransferase